VRDATHVIRVAVKRAVGRFMAEVTSKAAGPRRRNVLTPSERLELQSYLHPVSKLQEVLLQARQVVEVAKDPVRAGPASFLQALGASVGVREQDDASAPEPAVAREGGPGGGPGPAKAVGLVEVLRAIEGGDW
jgi:hypothetical protein